MSMVWKMARLLMTILAQLQVAVTRTRQKETSLTLNIPRTGGISAGLVGTSIDGTVATPDHGVKNRYILPIYTKTIADSRNALANSYGF